MDINLNLTSTLQPSIFGTQGRKRFYSQLREQGGRVGPSAFASFYAPGVGSSQAIESR
jgi:hypothetical protein